MGRPSIARSLHRADQYRRLARRFQSDQGALKPLFPGYRKGLGPAVEEQLLPVVVQDLVKGRRNHNETD